MVAANNYRHFTPDMAKNYFYNLLLTLANILFPILSFPYVSRIIGPEGIGHVQFVFSFAQYFAILASIGVPIYGMKEISKYRSDPIARSKVFSELVIIQLFTSITLSIVYLTVILSLPYFASNLEMYEAATILIFLGFTNVEWVYSGLEEFKSIALRSVFFKIAGLALLYIFIRQRSDFKIYLYVMMFSYVANNVLSILLLHKKVRITFYQLQLRKHLMPLLYILGTTLAASMYTDMDTVLLGFLSNGKTVGFYTAAVKLSKISIPFVTSMAVILLPKIAKDFGDNNLNDAQLTLDKAFKFLAFFGVPVVFGLGLLAPEFILLFSGREFLPAANSMRLLSVLPLIIGFAHFLLFMVLVPSGKNRQMFICVICGVVSSLIFNFLLIPKLQQLGSSIANVCSEVVVTALYFYVIKRYFSFTFNWALVFKAILCAALFVPVISMIKGLHLPLIYTIVCCVFACGLTYGATQLWVFKNQFVYEILSYLKQKFTKVAAV